MWRPAEQQTGQNRICIQTNYLARNPAAPKFVVSMRPVAISPAAAPKAVGPYSVAIRIGDLIFASGQIPLDPANGAIVPGGIETQTERVLENIKTVLADQGLTLSNVVKTTVFMTNLGEFAQMNAIYARYFAEPFPARSTVQVSALPKGAAVEIEAIAHFSTP
jgi:2-iminobutanoate/2-iminopropanoate deaminase